MICVENANTTPKVSIIIPVWGSYTKYIPECLESVANLSFKDYEVILVDDKTDLPTARNCGILKARGEYILTLDVDDKLSSDYIEKTIGKGDIVTTYLQNFEDNNGKMTPPNKPTIDMFMGGNVIPSCALFKKSVWEDVGGYDENLKEGWEDYDFWVRCVSKGYEIVTVPEFLYFYRKHGETMALQAGKKALELQSYILNKYKNSTI